MYLMANISKIKLPGADSPYNVYDSTALHEKDADSFDAKGSAAAALTSAKEYADTKASAAETEAKKYTDGKVASAVHFKGTKASESVIKAIASALIGDIWLNSSDNSEWICIRTISSADPNAWEKLGDVHDAASTTHVHSVTISPTSKQTVYSMSSDGKVGQGSPASLGDNFYTPGENANYTGHDFTPNRPTKIDVSKFNGGTQAEFTQGKKANWQASVSEDGTLSFVWEANGDDNFKKNTVASLGADFYTAGTQATHSTGTFYGGKPTVINVEAFNGGKPTSVTLPTRTKVGNVWTGADKTVETTGPKQPS